MDSARAVNQRRSAAGLQGCGATNDYRRGALQKSAGPALLKPQTRQEPVHALLERAQKPLEPPEPPECQIAINQPQRWVRAAGDSTGSTSKRMCACARTSTIQSQGVAEIASDVPASQAAAFPCQFPRRCCCFPEAPSANMSCQISIFKIFACVHAARHTHTHTRITEIFACVHAARHTHSRRTNTHTHRRTQTCMFTHEPGLLEYDPSRKLWPLRRLRFREHPAFLSSLAVFPAPSPTGLHLMAAKVFKGWGGNDTT